MCAFGLPGKTHDDCPARAVLAALSIARGMKVGRLRPLPLVPSAKIRLLLLAACAIPDGMLRPGMLFDDAQALTHSLGPADAIAVVMNLSDNAQEAGERAAVGVTTGQLLCACVGSRSRAEYTIFGDAINLAARCNQPSSTFLPSRIIRKDLLDPTQFLNAIAAIIRHSI